MSMHHVRLKLEGDRVVGFDPAAPNAERTVTERTVTRHPATEIHELIQKGLSDARRTPAYFEEAFSQGHINVALVFEMLAAFKEMRNDSARCTQLTINELRTICELRVGPIPQDEIRQVIANIAKRAVV